MAGKYLEAIIFDLDGVIVDSMPMHTAAWRRYLGQHGLDSDGIEDRMHGKRNDEIVRTFWGDLSGGENFRHGAAKEALWREMMAPELESRLVPGIRQFLAQYGELPMGVATNAEPANADFVLDRGKLRTYFRVIVDGMQVQRPKPWPDVYQRAAKILGVEPGSCLVFEDSPTGVAAAKAAGATVVGITTHGELEGVALSMPHFLDPALHEWVRARFRISSLSGSS